jgi:hypothetical protein
MYERFTVRARKVMQLANQEAQRFNHEYVGTEHMLLGLIREGSGVAANVLKNLDIDLPKIRLEVEKLVQSGPDIVTTGELPQTPRAKKVIEYSMEEARYLNHNYVGTEHILLGLLREQEGVAAQVLMNLGLTLEVIRDEVIGLLGCGDQRATAGSMCQVRCCVGHGWAVMRRSVLYIAACLGFVVAGVDLIFLLRVVPPAQQELFLKDHYFSAFFASFLVLGAA